MALTPELDIRFYGANGKRKMLPSDWVVSIEWETGERGGFLSGTLKVQAPYGMGSTQSFLTVEVEHIDVRLWGILLYRGFVRISQSDTTGTDQTDSPTLYGMIEILNGYLVRRHYCYAVPVSPDVLFADLVNDYVKRSGRQPNIVIDVAGVSSMGLLIQQFDATGKSFPQALNDLCDLFPQRLIWGCDVDGSGTDRIYLRPRVSTVKYKFAVGRDVQALLYPRDATQVTNRLVVTGASLDGSGYPPNLCPNGSFEDCAIPGEMTSNLLQNPSFDLDNAGTRPGNGWQTQGDPSVDGTYGRSGNAAVLDNNPSSPEAIYQDLGVAGGVSCHASCWAMVITGETWRFRFILSYLDGSGTVLDTITSAYITPPSDNVYRHYQLDWTNPSAATAVKLRWRLETDPANSGAHGLDIDDCSGWVDRVSAASWQIGQNSNAAWALLDWSNHDGAIVPYDGGTMVKAQASITGAGGYAEITTISTARITVKHVRVYYVSAWIYVAAGTTVQAAIGGRVYAGGTLQNTLVGAVRSLTATGWNLISYIVTTGTASDGLDVIVRLYNGTQTYIDAVSVFENNLPNINHQEIYYPASTYTAVRDVNDYVGVVSSDAGASIANWGPREKQETNTNILSISDLDAYCIAYFNAHAVSLVNAGLTIFGPIAPVYLDGLVQIENLPTSPPALFASRVRYKIDQGGIGLTVDLNNEQPDLALLLREIQEGKR
jgi:hypothetical protein